MNTNLLKGCPDLSQSYKCISLTSLQVKQDMNALAYNHSLIRDLVILYRERRRLRKFFGKGAKREH